MPNEILVSAMKALKTCGGNVAVRSSATNEDEEGSTHSGKFESVLYVETQSQKS